jgi:hypothetical protein
MGVIPVEARAVLDREVVEIRSSGTNREARVTVARVWHL